MKTTFCTIAMLAAALALQPALALDRGDPGYDESSPTGSPSRGGDYPTSHPSAYPYYTTGGGMTCSSSGCYGGGTATVGYGSISGGWSGGSTYDEAGIY